MRAWLKDRARLALRKVLPRLMAFACSPTQAEWNVIVAGVLRQMDIEAQRILRPGFDIEPTKSDRTKLH